MKSRLKSFKKIFKNRRDLKWRLIDRQETLVIQKWTPSNTITNSFTLIKINVGHPELLVVPIDEFGVLRMTTIKCIIQFNGQNDDGLWRKSE